MSREEVLIITIVMLVIIVSLLILRLFQYKRQVKSFVRRTRERNNNEINRPVNVDIFQKEFVDLANALNEYTDKLKEKSHALERERDRLNKVIAGISHDFRTPLTAARGYMQMVEKSNLLEGKNLQYQKIAIEKIDYLKELSDAFFEVAYDSASEQDIKIEKVDIAALLTSQLLDQYEWVNERNIETQFNIPEKEMIVDTNKHFMERILDNIFSNARKYTVSTLSVELQEKEKSWQIIIENDISNTDAIDTNQIFELFYRDSSRTKSGSGIGLYIVKKFADRLGHKISAEASNHKFSIILEMSKG